MSDKVKKIVVRVLAVVLTALMILSVCAQFVFAAEEKKAPTTTVTISLKGLTQDFPHTEVLALVSNVSTYKSQSVLLRKDKNFTADVDLEDGYYFVYSNKHGWKDQNNNTLVINNNEPYNFYVGKSFDKNRYPDYTFSQSKNITVPFNKVNKDVESDLTKIVDQNTVIYWDVRDLIYPMQYIYDMDEFKEALLNSPLAKGELSNYEEYLGSNEQKAQNVSTDIEKKWSGLDVEKTITSNEENPDNKEEATTGSDNQNTENGNQNNNQIKVENENEKKELETEPFDEKATEAVEEEKEDITFWDFILQMLWDSKLLILILIASFVGLFIIKRKNREKILKQMEEDSYDDSRIE